MHTWNILNKLKDNKIIDLLLENRDIKTQKEKEAFLNPKLEDVTIKSVGIDEKELKKALSRIEKAIKNKEQIVVFGDYDVDGITGAAILWETLHSLGAKVMPYIPHRIDEGYGLSIIGIENFKDQKSNLKDTSLIITVDNGIVANEAVDFANKQGIDVIITDHHVPPDTELPKAHAIVHTTKLCGAGVAYVLAKELKNDSGNHLELAALATIADMVPLTNSNRTIVKHGLESLSKTKRLGLLELFKQAGLEKKEFTPYDVGYIISPRLNASGRIESAMESLRLLCTKDINRARTLAEKLEHINRERQLILKQTTVQAIEETQKAMTKDQKLIVSSDASYQQGVIGLVAGKLVQEFYKPSIVISIGENHSKASARSVSGFDMIEFLRTHTDHFVNVGGHPMAAGFTIETSRLEFVKKKLIEEAQKIITEELLKKSIKIDCELSFSNINQDLYDQILTLAPFGVGNPEPVFTTKNVIVDDFKLLGKEKNHLKLYLREDDSKVFEAIAFGAFEFASKMKKGDKIDVAYILDENSWNGNTKLQLKIKDIKIHE